MLIRTSIAAVAIAFGVGDVVAQSDPIAARKALMKQNNNGAKSISQMARGQAPFDAAKVDAAFAQWADTASKFGALFPDSSKTGDKTRASPKVWQTRADFDAKLADFGKAVADNRDKAKASVDGLKAALPAVGKTCDGCHETYRLSD